VLDTFVVDEMVAELGVLMAVLMDIVVVVWSVV